MRVWVDIDNAPHVQIFAPIIRRLRQAGADVCVSARDRTYVPQLLEAAGIGFTTVGRGQPAGTLAKITALGLRAAQLTRFAAGKRIDVAVGHGSRSLAVAARMLGTRNLTMFDYEHVSTWLFRRCCDRVLIPRAVIENGNGDFSGAPWIPFDGFKEEIYLADFRPDPSLRERLGISQERILMVVRPPSQSAHYHDSRSEAILEGVAALIRDRPEVHAIWLRRDPSDPVPEFARRPNITVPNGPLDGLSLLSAADLVVSGGGTMTREAALLGTPAYSIFTGTPGLLDAQLVASGRLTTVRSTDQLVLIRLERKRQVDAMPVDGRLRDFVMHQIESLAAREAPDSPGGVHARALR